jgi:hypothetical protein
LRRVGGSSGVGAFPDITDEVLIEIERLGVTSVFEEKGAKT